MQDTPATSSSAPHQSIRTSRLRNGSRSTRLVTNERRNAERQV